MNGWLSPRGKFYPCGISEHIAKARELFLDAKNPEKRAEDCHWIKITPNYLLGVDGYQFVIASHVTQSQINFLFDLVNGKEREGDYEYMFQQILKEIDNDP